LLGTLGTNPSIIYLALVKILSFSNNNMDSIGPGDAHFTLEAILVSPYHFTAFRVWIFWARVALNITTINKNSAQDIRTLERNHQHWWSTRWSTRRRNVTCHGLVALAVS